MRHNFTMFWRLFSLSLRAQMEYKLDFIVSNILRSLLAVVDFLLVAVILVRFEAIDGWSIYQVGLLFGTASLAMALYRSLAAAVHNFESVLINGEFDSLLIRPLPTLLTLMTRKIELRWFGHILQALAVIIICSLQLSLPPKAWFFLLLMPLWATGMLLAISLATITLGFWLTRIDELLIFSLYAPNYAASYPLSIFPNWLKSVFFTVLPIAYINYVPLLYLLSKGGEWWWLLLPPLVSTAALILAYRFWLFGQSRYHSTGS